MNWYDVISNKIRPKRSSFWVRFGSSKQLTKANFLGEFVLAPKQLWAIIGPWWLRKRWVCSGAPPSLTCVFFFFPVRFSFNGGQAGEQQLQVTSNINTLCRIAEKPQIYPHLHNHSRGDFKDSEKAFSSYKEIATKLGVDEPELCKKWRRETSDASFPKLWKEWNERVKI